MRLVGWVLRKSGCVGVGVVFFDEVLDIGGLELRRWVCKRCMARSLLMYTESSSILGSEEANPKVGWGALNKKFRSGIVLGS